MSSHRLPLKRLLTRRNVLFAIGMLFGLVGFVLAHEQNIPFVSHLFYKDVNGLRAGFNDVCGLPVGIKDVSERYRSLRNGDGELTSQEYGFKELSNFILRDLRGSRSEYFAKTWSGTRSFKDYREIALKNGFSKMSYQGIPGNVVDIHAPIGNNRINVYLKESPDEYASFFVHLIDEGIEKEYRRTTFGWASLLYFIGVFILVFQHDWRSV